MNQIEPKQTTASVALGKVFSQFNLAELRLPTGYVDGVDVQKEVTRVAVRKPTKTEFFRVRPGEQWRFPAMILEIKEVNELYLVVPGIAPRLPGLVRPATLHCAIDRSDNVFVLPVPLPGIDGQRNPWHQSLANAVSRAERSWVRSVANMSQGAYDLYVAQGKLEEPCWPEKSFDALMSLAFAERIISDENHPVVRQLFGIV